MKTKISRCLLAAFALWAGGIAQAQQAAGPFTDSREIPDTPAYRRAREVVALLQRGDTAAVEAYARENFTPEFLEALPLAAHADLFRQLYAFHGDLETVAARHYGLGWAVQPRAGGRTVGHSGGFSGISATFRMYLDSGYTVVVLANYGGVAQLVENQAMELLEQGR